MRLENEVLKDFHFFTLIKCKHSKIYINYDTVRVWDDLKKYIWYIFFLEFTKSYLFHESNDHSYLWAMKDNVVILIFFDAFFCDIKNAYLPFLTLSIFYFCFISSKINFDYRFIVYLLHSVHPSPFFYRGYQLFWGASRGGSKIFQIN